MMYDFGEVERVAGEIRAPFEPQVGIITGSGLSGLAEEVEERRREQMIEVLRTHHCM